MDPLPSSIGRYQVRERLGQGGMGVLYLALDPTIDRLVALKLLRADDAELRERFQREARLVARLQSPGIVTIYEIATHNDQPFMAMEYVAGDTLEAIIRRRAPLPVTRKLTLAIELCDALAAAHRAGIIHRDIKPANLIVQRESGLLKVLDFGIARTIDSSLTQVGAILGTPNYISPEQVEGRPVDHRSDQFAVGVTLYELLAYRQAFTGDTPFLVLQRIVHGTPEPLLDLEPTLDPALQAIVDRAMAKDPAARYADMDAMRADLQHVLRRAEAGSQQATLVISAAAPAAGGAARGRTSGTDLARFLEQRAAQISQRLHAAEAALARGEPELALIEAEQAAVIDPHEARTMATLERVRAAVDRARDLARLVERARLHAESCLQEGDLPGARRAAAEAQGYDPASIEALQVRQRVEAAIEARAREAIAQAEEEEWQGDLQGALARLEAFRPSHDAIDDAAARLREQLIVRQREAERAARVAAAVEERLTLARTALARGDIDAAEAAVASARQLDESHAEAAALDRDVVRALAARQRDERRRERTGQKSASGRLVTWHPIGGDDAGTETEVEPRDADLSAAAFTAADGEIAPREIAKGATATGTLTAGEIAASEVASETATVGSGTGNDAVLIVEAAVDPMFEPAVEADGPARAGAERTSLAAAAGAVVAAGASSATIADGSRAERLGADDAIASSGGIASRHDAQQQTASDAGGTPEPTAQEELTKLKELTHRADLRGLTELADLKGRTDRADRAELSGLTDLANGPSRAQPGTAALGAAVAAGQGDDGGDEPAIHVTDVAHAHDAGTHGRPPASREESSAAQARTTAAAVAAGVRGSAAKASPARESQSEPEGRNRSQNQSGSQSDAQSQSDSESKGPWWRSTLVGAAAAGIAAIVLISIFVLRPTASTPSDTARGSGRPSSAASTSTQPGAAGDASASASPSSSPSTGGSSAAAGKAAADAAATTPTGTPAGASADPRAVTDAAVVESNVAGIIDRVRSLLEGRQDAAALDEMTRALAAYGQHPRIQALLDETVRAAEEDAQRARRRAVRAQAAVRATSELARADDALLAAGRMPRDKQAIDAARVYWRAARMFTAAGEQAALAPPEPGRAPTPEESTAIQAALNRWASAYATLDVKKVSDAWPAMSRDQERALDDAFKGMTRYTVTFQGCQIVLPGTRASASCLLRRAIDYKAATPQRFDSRVLFQLELRGERWTIVDVRQV